MSKQLYTEFKKYNNMKINFKSDNSDFKQIISDVYENTMLLLKEQRAQRIDLAYLMKQVSKQTNISDYYDKQPDTMTRKTPEEDIVDPKAEDGT